MCLVDVLFCNEWEAPILLKYKEGDPRLPLKTLHDAKEAAIQLVITHPTLKRVVVSVAALHVSYDTSEGVMSMGPLPNTKLVDVVGAADAFVGVYVHGAYISGKNAEDALRWAACASTLATMTEGAQTSMPTLTRLKEYIADNQEVGIVVTWALHSAPLHSMNHSYSFVSCVFRR
jgi:sugar/nucleoside kinase (ribokinase family)